MRTRISAVCLLSVTLLAASAHAGAIPGMGTAARAIRFGIGGGASVPIADAADAYKSGAHGQAYASWAPGRAPFGLRVAVNYDRYGLKGLSAGQDGHGTILSGLGNASYGFPIGPVKPYLIAGLGVFNVGTSVSGTGGGTSSTTKFGVNAGAGVQVKIAAISAFLEGRFDNIFTDQGLATGASSTQNLKAQIIPVTFGIEF